MKKIIFISFIFCFYSIKAQIKVRPGIKAGLNSTNVSNFNSEAKQDFYAGAFAVVKFTKFYNLQPEIIYSKQGFKNKSVKDNNIELNYLSVALANKFFPIKKAGLHFIVGPSIDLKVNNVPNYFNNFNTEKTDDFAPFDFSLFGGIGYEFPFGLTIEARYKQGFIDINNNNFDQNVKYEELIVNKVFQVGVSYYFNF